MAGAVSAGAYTAGVMDYLIETLERWEQFKKTKREKLEKGQELTEDEKRVPDHDVVIDVLSGASAGGMTAAVLSYSLMDDTYLNKLDGEISPGNYNLPNQEFQKSKLYDCWIKMADEPEKITLDKLLDTGDVQSIDKMNALLNSKAINEIANNATPKKFRDNSNFPNYFNKELSIFLTVTNLDGLPIEIKFGNTTDTKNIFKMHSGFLHYSFAPSTINNLVYPFESLTDENYKNLIAAAKSTGAFPIGLENQSIKILKKYMQQYKDNLLTQHNLNLVYDCNDDYRFTAVDGGLINNEPIGTTAKFLNRNLKKEDIKPYMVLIDPFPNITTATKKENKSQEQDSKYNLLQVVLKLFGAVRNHSMFKQEDLIDGLNMEKNKYLIYPSKNGYYFLSCGLIGGFSGFFKRSFREHDYQLGRKNCQTFLRYYFGETVSDFAAMGIEFDENQQKIWGYHPNKDKNEELKMPLIPDMLFLKQLNTNEDYTEKSRGREIETPHYDGLTKDELHNINAKIEERIAKIIAKSYHLIDDIKGNFWANLAKCLFKSKIKNAIKNLIMSKITDYLQDVFKPQFIKQELLVEEYIQTIVKNGDLYKKFKGVTVVVANGGEHIITYTSSGYETKNTAKKGDRIVTNQTEGREKYIVKAATFDRDYEDPDQSGVYYKKALIHALQFTEVNFPGLFKKTKKEHRSNSPLFIETSWKESQAIRKNDYLVCDQNQTEIYRIDRKEFEETYQLTTMGNTLN